MADLQTYGAPSSESAVALRQNRVLRNTYWLLAVSLIPTAIGAAVGANINLSVLRTNPIISFFVILAVFYGWTFAIERNRDTSLGVGLLLGFTLFRHADARSRCDFATWPSRLMRLQPIHYATTGRTLGWFISIAGLQRAGAFATVTD